MTFKKIICFIAVAMMTTVTGYAQQAGSGCTGQNCGGYGCHGGQDQYPSDTCCRRPWNYDEANALWAGYCTTPIRPKNHLFAGCNQVCTSCPSKWPANCGSQCGEPCGAACGSGGGGCGGGIFAGLSRGHSCGSCGGIASFGNGCGAGIGKGCGTGCGGLFSRTPMGKCDAYNPCDNVPAGGCDNWGCGPRHGMDLFSGLKSRGCGCGLRGTNQCDSGCDSLGTSVTPTAGGQ